MSNKKVLIIDDDKEFLAEITETLALSGYDTISVHDVHIAMEMALKAIPDVILLDLKMPGKSGFVFAEELRHFSDVGHIPIIAMTGFFEEGFVPLMKVCGIEKYLRKPFHPLDVIAQVERAQRKNSEQYLQKEKGAENDSD